jgi:hypothetical protein
MEHCSCISRFDGLLTAGLRAPQAKHVALVVNCLPIAIGLGGFYRDRLAAGPAMQRVMERTPTLLDRFGDDADRDILQLAEWNLLEISS